MSQSSPPNPLDKHLFAWPIAGLIVYSVICFCLETIPTISSTTKTFLYYSEIITVLIFTIEYLARVILAKRKMGFVFSFFGMIDLLAILPFYLMFAIDLRSVRLLRLLRLARLLKLVRYNQALRRFGHALHLAKEELIITTIASLILIFLSAVGIYHFEHHAQPTVFVSIFDSLWWAVCTLTTVGYGDIFPITIGGKLFTFFILLIGLALIAVPTGIIASALSSVQSNSKTD